MFHFLCTKKSDFLNPQGTYSLRGVAMLMIILSHAHNGYPVSGDVYFPSWLNLLHMEFWGGMGVAVFLFLSGYGMTLSLSKREGDINRQYVTGKLRRLLEPFLIYWLVEIIVLLIFNRADFSWHLLEEFLTLSIHPDVENWFFKVIIGIYIVTILLYTVKLRQSVRIGLLFLFVVAYLFAMRSAGFGSWWYNTVLCFPIGTFVAYRKEWFAKLSPIPMMFLSFLLIVMISAVHFNDIALHLLFTCFCVYAISVVNINNRWLYFIGYNSLVFYFMECPVLDEIMKFSYSNFPSYCLLSLIGTYLLSWICVKFIQNTLK